MDKTIYKPEVFNKNNISEAKKIILTQEDEVNTDTRWEKETPFVVASIVSNLNITKDSVLLDFGCGIGRIAKEIIEKTSCKIIGVDISSSMRKMALSYVNHENFTVSSFKELSLNVKKGFRFDGAYSIWVLQHCLDPKIEIDLIKSSLKENKLFYVLNNKYTAVPTDKGWINNGIDIKELLKMNFEEIKSETLPLEVSSEKISKLTFISILKNIQRKNNMSSNKEVQDLLKEAVQKYKAKDLKTSKKLLEEILKIEKDNYEALGNLGVINRSLGNLKEAIYYYIQAIKLNPDNAMNYNNLGNAFNEAKDYKRAILAFSDCIKRDPKNANAYNNLGIVYEGLKDNKRAVQSYKAAIQINPKFSKAINNIGVILYKEKKYQEAIDIFKIALDVDENYHELHSNIGSCFNKLKKYDEAIQSLEKTIELLPNHAGAYTNLGNVYNKTHDYKKASQLHEKSILLDPKGFNAYSNVGTSYKQLGLNKKAIEAYQKAIELNPKFENAHFDLASMYLSQGEFEKGWSEYEWRFQKEEMLSHMIEHKDIFSKTMLKKDMNIEGKTLLLHSEQGFGDSIQFIRFLSSIKKKFKCKIAVKCRDELTELFKCIKDIDILVSRSEETPTFDVHLPIMSMPYILEMKDIKDIPKEKAYLQTKVNKKYKVKKEKGKINIGICWSASVTGESYEGKVFDLKYLDAFINSNNINVYSLQVGPEKADIKTLDYEDKIIDITSELSDFSKTASLMKSLDLVISSDTSVAHLAGALNIPVWIPLQKIPDWRWGNKGITSPWYPSATLFRQKTARVWDSVFQSMSSKIYQNFKIKI